jgi:hypothetical protein
VPTGRTRQTRQRDEPYPLRIEIRPPQMSITLRDHKMLWGRAGARCSMCRTHLATISDIGLASVIGEEAHIVARNVDGPRGTSPLATEQRNSYSNLLLLCPTHHAIIDDFPNGPVEYTVELLHRIKTEHEQWVMSLDSFDKNLQLAEEQWAAMVDALDKRMSWDSWTQDMSLLFSHDQLLSVATYERLKETNSRIFAFIWPAGHTYLRNTIKAMGRVLNDLLLTFEGHMTAWRDEDELLHTKKFYKIEYWSSEDYNALLAEYEVHTALVEDLCFELTRYGNLLAEVIRSEIDPTHRFEQGALLIRYGVDIMWDDTMYRPEFTEQEIEDHKQPYACLADFLKVRPTRELSEAKVGNPRTIAGRQDPTTPPGADTG